MIVKEAFGVQLLRRGEGLAVRFDGGAHTPHFVELPISAADAAVLFTDAATAYQILLRLQQQARQDQA